MFLHDTVQSNGPKPRSYSFSRFSPFICVAVKCLAVCMHGMDSCQIQRTKFGVNCKRGLVTIYKCEKFQSDVLLSARQTHVRRSPVCMACERSGMHHINQLSQALSKHTSMSMLLSIFHVQLLCYGNRQKRTMA